MLFNSFLLSHLSAITRVQSLRICHWIFRFSLFFSIWFFFLDCCIFNSFMHSSFICDLMYYSYYAITNVLFMLFLEFHMRSLTTQYKILVSQQFRRLRFCWNGLGLDGVLRHWSPPSSTNRWLCIFPCTSALWCFPGFCTWPNCIHPLRQSTTWPNLYIWYHCHFFSDDTQLYKIFRFSRRLVCHGSSQ
jgi:hypothetical protein